MQFFGAPALCDELCGEPIEQFRVAGCFSPDSEVARRPYQSDAEMILPDAVDPDASGEGIGGIDDRLGQFQPSTADLKRDRLWSRHHRDEMAGDFLATIGRISSAKDPCWPDCFAIDQANGMSRSKR